MNFKRASLYLPLILSFIFIDETCNNSILSIFSKETGFSEFILYFCFLLVSILASPIQAGYSDYYCRKKSIIISLSFSFSSVFFVYFNAINSSFLFLAIIILAKGGLGNILPLSWAAIADTQDKNFRFSFALSTSAMAFGYLVLVVIKLLFNEIQSLLIILAMLLVLIYLCFKYFNDIRDNSDRSESSKKTFSENFVSEVKLLLNNFIKDQRTRRGLAAFMLWEISFYTALVSDVDLKVPAFKYVSFSMLSGYIVGVVILKFCHRRTDLNMIKIGYLISFFSFLPVFVFYYLNFRVAFVFGYFFYSLAAAFLAPSLFSILSKERKPHEQGKIYGLIDSSDTISFLIASISLIIYNFMQIKPVFLSLFSFLILIFSLIPYERFKKTVPISY